jgi:hypothetical protein
MTGLQRTAASLSMSESRISVAGVRCRMRRWLLAFVVLPLGANADVPLECDIGPITKTFGSVPWLVYSCTDRTSLVLLTAPGSSASPFYFIFSLDGATYRLRGEGAGSEAATDAALRELQALSRREIEGLIRETRAAKGR